MSWKVIIPLVLVAGAMVYLSSVYAVNTTVD